MGDLEGRVAVVTGASRGIGRAIAIELAGAGARVALQARTGSSLDAVAEEIRARGGRVLATAVDVTDLDALRVALARVEGELGPVDILVNNAGRAESAPLHRTTDELWDRTMALNLRAPFALIRLVAPGMVRRGWGRIINMASTAALKGYAYTAAYTASKHGLLALTRSFSKELVAHGVTVNALCPGFVDTDLTRLAAEKIVAKTGRSVDETLAEMNEESPLGRLIRPAEVARAVLYLCGPETDAVSGQALAIAGGAVETG